MQLEGTIRSLGLHEVAQLVTLSRRSGVLQATAPADGRGAWIRFRDGQIVDAGTGAAPATATTAATAGRDEAVREAALSVLAWRDGRFRFDGAGDDASDSRVRLNTDAVLVESMERAGAWDALADRIRGPHVVPAYPEVQPQSLSLLDLQPTEWEVLTAIDGERDLAELAAHLRRETIAVATAVHRLIGTGLVVLREAVSPGGRTSPTLPTMRVVPSPASAARTIAAAPAPLRALPVVPPPGEAAGQGAGRDGVGGDVWVPTAPRGLAPIDDDDVIFDPLADGLINEDGLLRTPWRARAVTPEVAPDVVGPSSTRGASSTPRQGAVTAVRSTGRSGTMTVEETDAVSALVAAGDAAARRGEFAAALASWRAALAARPDDPAAPRVREAVMLVQRLARLLDDAS